MKKLKFLSLIYLIIPIIIFYLFYLKIYISIPLTLGLLFIIYKNKNEENCFNKKLFITIFVISIIICITAGLGNIFYQSNDWHWRNAIFRDMINKPWPVYYKSMNSTLSYYIGIWMLPSIIAKIFLPFGQNIAWIVGNIAVLLYASIGLTLVILWIIKSFNLVEKKKIFICLLLFLLFSGLDVLGIVILKRFNILDRYHLEWWAGEYQFSSIITQLFWVFNQSIAAWLITWMYLNEKKINNYFLLILIALPYCPLPFCGLMILFFASGIKYLIESIKQRKVIALFKEIFSVQNILALVTILPIYYFFYKTNGSTNEGSFRFSYKLINGSGLFYLLLFWFLEIGIYYILLFSKYRKNYLFHVSFLSLLIIPLFKIGNANDFSMRASIPLLIVCIYFVIDYYLKNGFNSLFVTIFIIGAITPCFEYLRAVRTIKNSRRINCVSDRIKTFENKKYKNYSNFLAPNPEETIFYKYLSRDIKEK